MVLIGPAASARRGITGTLEGMVRDKQSQGSLARANILILAHNQGTVSDENGFYQITNIRAGEYDVRFSLLGYGSVIIRGVKILPDLKTRLDAEMAPTPVELPASEVRAVRPLIQVDQAVTAFNIDEAKIDKLPVTNFQEVVGLQPGVTQEGNIRGSKTTDALYMVDGIPVQDVIGGGIATDIPKSSIGGMTVTTGGMDAEYGNALGGVINVVTKDVEKVAQVAFRIDRDDWLPTHLDQQTNQSFEGEFDASGPLPAEGLYYLTSDLYATSNTRWWQDFQSAVPLPVDREFSGLSKLEYVATPTLRFGIEGIYSFRHWRDYEFSWRYDLAGLPARSRDSYRVALTVSNTVSDELLFSGSLSASSLRSRINDGSKDDISLEPYEYDQYLQFIIAGSRSWWEDTRQNIYSAKGDVTWQLNRNHLLKAGVLLDQYHVTSDLVKYDPQLTYFGKPIPGAPLLNYSDTYDYWPRSGSAYLQDKIQLDESGANATVGLRWDFFDPTAERPVVEDFSAILSEYTQQVNGWEKASVKQQVSPRLSLAFPVNPTTFAFFNFGYYFQFPLFDYLYSGLNPSQLRQGTRTVLAGNPDLAPERVSLWEAGVKRTLQNDFVLSLTVFDKQMSNEIDSKTLVPFDSKFAGDYGFAEYVNTASASAWGVECVLSREGNERLSGSVSYTYMVTSAESEYADQSINIAEWGFPVAPVSYPLSWDQTHTLKFDIDSRLPGGIRSNLTALYYTPRPYTYYPTRDGYTPEDTSKLFVPNNARMSQYFSINWKLSWTIRLSDLGGTAATIYADIRNLLNARNVKWVDSNGRIGGELNDPGAYYDPRRVKVGLRIDL